MKYTCSLNNLEFYAFHGVYEEENILGGLFIVHIEVSRDVLPGENLQSLEKVYNYEVIYDLVDKNMKIRTRLIETVAKRIFDDMEQVLRPDTLRVTISKPNPAGLFKSGNASVTLVK